MSWKRTAFGFLSLFMFCSAVFADLVTLTDGRAFRGIDFKKVKQGHLFTIENGKTVFIKSANFESFEKSPPGETVSFRGKDVSLRTKIRTLQKEHKAEQQRLMHAIGVWAAGGSKAEQAKAEVLERPERERELLFGKTLLKNSSARARILATKQLAALKTEHAVKSLAYSLVQDRHSQVRTTCAEALQTFADPHLGEHFIPFLFSGNKYHRARASKAIQTFPSYRAVPALITTITKIWSGGQRSHFYLGTQRAFIKDYELVSGGTTIRLTEVADPIIKFAETGIVLDAKIAKTEQRIHIQTLERITGLDYGRDMGRWLAWWKQTGKDLALKHEAVKKATGSSTATETPH